MVAENGRNRRASIPLDGACQHYRETIMKLEDKVYRIRSHENTKPWLRFEGVVTLTLRQAVSHAAKANRVNTSWTHEVIGSNGKVVRQCI